jgi:hypothetical protein
MNDDLILNASFLNRCDPCKAAFHLMGCWDLDVGKQNSATKQRLPDEKLGRIREKRQESVDARFRP